jgi:hypothetical protein
MIWPLIDWFTKWLTEAIFIYLDRGCSMNPLKTKSNTIQEYVATYGGPEFDIHNK